MGNFKYKYKTVIQFFDKVLKSRYFLCTTWIISILACLVTLIDGISSTKNKPSNQLVKEMHSAKEEIINDRMINYVDTINHIEQKRYLTIEDSLLMYIDILDKFINYKIESLEDRLTLANDYIYFYNQSSRLSNSKSFLISTIILNTDTVTQGISTSLLMDKISLLLYNMKDMNKDFVENHRKLNLYLEKLDGEVKDISEIEKYLKEDYELYHSKKFFETELCFLELVVEYNQKVKSALIKEREENG